MPQLLVRNLEEVTIARLKALAKQHGRSLQGQVKVVLEEAASLPAGEVTALFAKWERRFEGRRFRDSARIIRKDRER
jgi:plasmid stability protein